nr:interferon-induced very large GTPase 1-like [Nerophis lumbriciformis]
MSTKLTKKPSSKRKKHPKNTTKFEVLTQLGLEDFYPSQLEPASILDLSTWILDNLTAREPNDLPKSFLQRLWLLRPDARHTCCKALSDATENLEKKPANLVGSIACTIHPLDLVTAVYQCSNTFLQQEMTAHMLHCRFAVPLVLPYVDDKEPSSFLLWPLRGVVRQWHSQSVDGDQKIQEAILASTSMPIISCVRLGSCSVSKSEVLNHVISSETFVHKGMEGGQLPRNLSNGLVETAWYLPLGDPVKDNFVVPVVFCNLRGDACMHEKCLSLLSQASSAVIVLCENPEGREKQLLASWQDITAKLIVIDLSKTKTTEDRMVKFSGKNLQEELGLPLGSVISGTGLNAEKLANVLCQNIKHLLPDLRLVTLEGAAKLAVEQGFDCDEGAVCKKTMATAEEILKGLNEGAAVFRQKQLPLQGALWSRLAEIDKEESRRKKERKEFDFQLQNEKKDILRSLSKYKNTQSMKNFTNAISTTDKFERMYFLNWMRVKLRLLQRQKEIDLKDLLINQQTEEKSSIPELSELQNGTKDLWHDSTSFCTDSTFEDEENLEFTDSHQVVTDSGNEVDLKSISRTKDNERSESLLSEHLDSNEKEIPDKGALDVPGNNSIDSTHQKTTSVGQVASVEGETIKSELPCFLGLEHFFREMGLIFELTQINPGSGSHDELRLPSIAADLILSGVPLELMDGDASNLPMRWLCSVLAEIEHRFPRERFRTLTSLGAHHARNAEILSALFGVKFPDEPKRSTRGVYMVALQLPTKVKKKLNFDFLLLLDVEGLCCTSSDGQINEIIDNEMATVAAGMCDVLLQNIYSCSASELETNLTVAVNALLRIREYGSMPICKVLIQDEGINTILEATQLNRVSKILQIRTREQSLTDSDAINHNSKNKHSIVYVRPWYNEPLSKSINSQHSEAVLKLKRTLFGALKEASTLSGTSGMPEFMGRLYSVWEAVKAEASVCLQNKDIAFAFSLFCTELAKWEEILLDHMECWLTQATKTISSTKPEALDPSSQNDFLCELKYDAKREVKREVNKLKSNMKASLKENKLDVYIRILNTILSSYMIELEERITAMVIARLETINESHFSSTQFNRIETILETEQNVRLQGLLDRSASKNQLLHDKELEEEFEDVWKEALSKMEFRPSESEDITERVKNILAANIVRHGPQKHLNKLSAFGQNQTTHFRVDDQYFGYSSRMKNLFENQNKTPKAKAQQLSSNLMDYYQQFVAEKVSLPQDFSDSYITELLEMIDKTLKDSQLEIRTAFEVDLKVFICNAACKDFQRVHNRFAKDGELLKSFKAKKNAYMAQFIYQFRKRDQRQRFAQRFVSDIIQPTVMDYVYRPLGMQITEEIQSKVMQYRSPWAFHKSLLEELIQVDRFECFTEYLFSYDIFRMRKIQETVVAHLSEWNVNTWRHQRLGEIIGKVAAAASQVAEGTNAVLSDTKPLLEQVCLILEDEGVQIPWESLKGPTYSISTEWDCFVTCFMELLAALRLDLAQTFSQQLEIDELLELLPIQPKDCLFNKVNGCEARCPLCSAPCRVEKIRNHVHETSLHRPKCILGSTSVITSESTILNDLDTQGAAVTCWELQPFNPEWNLSPEVTSSQTPCLYWRYVLARFNERFAMKYNQRPALIPDEWKAITQDEVLASLRDNFLPRENSSKES